MVMSPYEWKIRVGWKIHNKQNNQHAISTRFRLTTNKMSNLKYHRIEKNLQYLSISLGSHYVVWDLIHRYMSKIFTIRRKTLSNQTTIDILFLQHYAIELLCVFFLYAHSCVQCMSGFQSYVWWNVMVLNVIKLRF